MCYKADRAGDGVSVRRGAPLREIVAKSPGRGSGPEKWPRNGGDSLRRSLSERHGVRIRLIGPIPLCKSRKHAENECRYRAIFDEAIIPETIRHPRAEISRFDD